MIENFLAHPLQERIFDKGECVYQCPSVKDIREYCAAQMDTIWDEVLRFENPHKYYVCLFAGHLISAAGPVPLLFAIDF